MFPTIKVDVFSLIKYWKMTRRKRLWQWEAVLCVNVTLLQREMLNIDWHWAASPVSKFRISSHTTPEIINSGLCSQPLPLICGAFVQYFSPQWLRKLTVLCRWTMGSTRSMSAVRITFLAANVSTQESVASPLLGPNNFSHTWFASNLGNSSLSDFFDLNEFPHFLRIRQKIKNR